MLRVLLHAAPTAALPQHAFTGVGDFLTETINSVLNANEGPLLS